MRHRHPANIARHDQQTWQERLPDRLTAALGTMTFIYWSALAITAWVVVNSLGLFLWHWDPYPFVFLNLGFSAFAYFSAPLILMSQNRQTEHDRVSAEEDYTTNQEALAILRDLAKDRAKLLAVLAQGVQGGASSWSSSEREATRRSEEQPGESAGSAEG